MTVDPSVIPGLLLLFAELAALTVVGYVVARVALRQADDSRTMAQGMIIGPALWGLAAGFVLYLIPGRGGALVTWLVVGSLAAVMVWRSAQRILPCGRVLATFTGVAIVVFGVMLAARQWLRIPDDNIHLGISAYVQAGGWPPIAPWIPGQQLFYHYGADVLIALLAPPGGPDLAFTTEILGAYVWTGFVFVLVTSVLKRAGWIGICALTPLALSTGAWTLIGFYIPPPDIVKIPVLSGVPAAGLRAALANVYWPEVSLQWQTEFEASPPNIWKPPFVMAYALTVIIVGWAGSRRERTWPAVISIAALVAFLGLLVEEIALVVLVLWCGLEVMRLVSAHRIISLLRDLWPSQRRRGSTSPQANAARDDARPAGRTDSLPAKSSGQVGHASRWRSLLPGAAGPFIAAVLLAIGGGFFTAALSSEVSGASLGLIDDPGSRRPFGTLFHELAGGIGILGLGVVPVCVVALLAGWRNRQVLAMIVGSSVFMFAAVIVQHRASQFDVTRMDGHARNFALLALLMALSLGLSALRPSWRYGAGILLLVLVTWPTIAEPARMLGAETARGIVLANADFGGREREPEFDSDAYYGGMGRFAIQQKLSNPVASYIRDHTAVDARILSPNPQAMSIGTGRPNASGFSGLRHLVWKIGPAYIDAIRYLEPAAIRRLGYSYVHVTDEWRTSLPSRAQGWLNDSTLFTPLVRGAADALLRIEPQFLELDVTPAAESFEALRRAVPSTATVYLGNGISEPMASLRAASTLRHARLIGDVKHSHIYLLSDIPTSEPDERLPDVVIVRKDLVFYANRSPELDLIWQGEGFAAYATQPGIAPSIGPAQVDPDFVLRLSNVTRRLDAVRFTATFIDKKPEKWSGQDWLLVPVDDSVWRPLFNLKIVGSQPDDGQWFAGSVSPGTHTTTVTYEFDAQAGRLAVQKSDGSFAEVQSSASTLEPGRWMLIARLRHAYLQAALIPVMTVEISEGGSVRYTAHEGDLEAVVEACPDRLQHTDSCRHLASLAGATTARSADGAFRLPGDLAR